MTFRIKSLEDLIMRKHSISIFCIFLGIIILFFYFQWGQEMEICNSTSETAENYYSLNITIVANKIYIADKQEFAELVIQKCVTNNWNEMRFSYDLSGYPNELCADVYMNNYAYEHGRKANFRIIYSQDSKYHYKYNIKDNPDKFAITIE